MDNNSARPDVDPTTLSPADKIRYIKDNSHLVVEFWELFFPEFPELPDQRQCAHWLKDFSLTVVLAGLNAAAVKLSSELQEGKTLEEHWSRVRVLQIASGSMRTMKLSSMTEEEKDQHVSKIRSLAGKKGAAKRWRQEEKEAKWSGQVAESSDVTWQNDGKTDFAMNLPSFATSCSGSGSSSCSFSSTDTTTVSASGSSEATTTAKAKATAKATGAAPPAPPVVDQKTKGKPENQKAKTKGSTGRKAKDGTPYPEGFDSWTNAERLEWLEEHKRVAAASYTSSELDADLDADSAMRKSAAEFGEMGTQSVAMQKQKQKQEQKQKQKQCHDSECCLPATHQTDPSWGDVWHYCQKHLEEFNLGMAKWDEYTRNGGTGT